MRAELILATQVLGGTCHASARSWAVLTRLRDEDQWLHADLCGMLVDWAPLMPVEQQLGVLTLMARSWRARGGSGAQPHGVMLVALSLPAWLREEVRSWELGL